MEPNDIPFSEINREVLKGTMYQSGLGQVVIDEHASDVEHLMAPATHAEQPLHRCRKYLKDLIPPEWLGKKGEFWIDRMELVSGEVVTLSITFIQKP